MSDNISHWLETAYSRVCAGEAEADVLRDCGWERVDDADALRLDAERYRWLREWMVRHSILCLEYGGRWALRKPHVISSSVGCGETEDAAIDAAMQEDET